MKKNLANTNLTELSVPAIDLFEDLQEGLLTNDIISTDEVRQIESAVVDLTPRPSPGRIVGTLEDDLLTGTPQSDQIFALDGNDIVIALSGSDRIFGGSGADLIVAGGGNDFIDGEAGNDQIFGDAGNDDIKGGGGVDVINGGGGSDLISGNQGGDRISGEAGNDIINGNGGQDILNGGNDADIISGGGDNDRAFGGAGNDDIFGDGGNDALNGDAGDDLVEGGAGNDTVFGGTNNDTVAGGNGADEVIGGAGDDSLSGGSGNDTLIGVDPFVGAFGFGSGELDTLDGGAENDTFVLGEGDRVYYLGEGNDDFALITDFESQDTIQLPEAFNSTNNVATEIDDAGQSLATAQVISGGTEALDRITGTIASENDVDLFQIDITGGGNFSATTVGGADFDTQLFLFDGDGFSVLENDDDGGLQSTISDDFAPLTPGTYFLAISSFDNDPTGSPLDGFTGNGGSTGNYTIDLTGVEADSSEIEAVSAFSLGASPAALPPGTAISFEDDLIAIVQGVSPSDLSLNGDDFAFA